MPYSDVVVSYYVGCYIPHCDQATSELVVHEGSDSDVTMVITSCFLDLINIKWAHFIVMNRFLHKHGHYNKATKRIIKGPSSILSFNVWTAAPQRLDYRTLESREPG